MEKVWKVLQLYKTFQAVEMNFPLSFLFSTDDFSTDLLLNEFLKMLTLTLQLNILMSFKELFTVKLIENA